MLRDGTHHQDLGADHFDRRANEVKARHHVAQLARLRRRLRERTHFFLWKLT